MIPVFLIFVVSIIIIIISVSMPRQREVVRMKRTNLYKAPGPKLDSYWALDGSLLLSLP